MCLGTESLYNDTSGLVRFPCLSRAQEDVVRFTFLSEPKNTACAKHFPADSGVDSLGLALKQTLLPSGILSRFARRYLSR
jgi:hypothetical protein